MDPYYKSRMREVRYFMMAVALVMAFAFMSNEVPATMSQTEAQGKEQEEVDDTLSQDLPVATEGETYVGGYDKDGYPLRGYLSSDEVRGDHLKSKSLKKRFRSRLMKVYEDFIDTMGRKTLEIAVHFSKNKGVDIPPSVIMAQAISESRYGTSRLAVEGKNYFGIQYRGKKRGIKGSISANDADHTKKIRKYGFAHYETPWWSLYHHAMLLKDLYGRRLITADIPLRERWFAAICGCDDSRMLASDSKKERTGNGFYYAAACEYLAKDGKTSKYVATLKYLVRIHNLDKLDREWERLKHQ